MSCADAPARMAAARLTLLVSQAYLTRRPGPAGCGREEKVQGSTTKARRAPEGWASGGSRSDHWTTRSEPGAGRPRARPGRNTRCPSTWPNPTAGRRSGPIGITRAGPVASVAIVPCASRTRTSSPSRAKSASTTINRRRPANGRRSLGIGRLKAEVNAAIWIAPVLRHGAAGNGTSGTSPARLNCVTSA